MSAIQKIRSNPTLAGRLRALADFTAGIPGDEFDWGIGVGCPRCIAGHLAGGFGTTGATDVLEAAIGYAVLSGQGIPVASEINIGWTPAGIVDIPSTVYESSDEREKIRGAPARDAAVAWIRKLADSPEVFEWDMEHSQDAPAPVEGRPGIKREADR